MKFKNWLAQAMIVVLTAVSIPDCSRAEIPVIDVTQVKTQLLHMAVESAKLAVLSLLTKNAPAPLMAAIKSPLRKIQVQNDQNGDPQIVYGETETGYESYKEIAADKLSRLGVGFLKNWQIFDQLPEGVDEVLAKDLEKIILQGNVNISDIQRSVQDLMGLSGASNPSVRSTDQTLDQMVILFLRNSALQAKARQENQMELEKNYQASQETTNAFDNLTLSYKLEQIREKREVLRDTQERDFRNLQVVQMAAEEKAKRLNQVESEKYLQAVANDFAALQGLNPSNSQKSKKP